VDEHGHDVVGAFHAKHRLLFVVIDALHDFTTDACTSIGSASATDNNNA
jgi:hypothetical protein